MNWERAALGTPPVWIGDTERPYRFRSPCSGTPFALLLAIGDEDIAPDEQHALAREIVEAGCRYAVCWGHGCTWWDEAIDMVCVLDELDGRPRPLVMTTWHEAESLEETAEFFANGTRIDDAAPRAYVALTVGGPPGLRSRVRAAVLGELSRRHG